MMNVGHALMYSVLQYCMGASLSAFAFPAFLGVWANLPALPVRQVTGVVVAQVKPRIHEYGKFLHRTGNNGMVRTPQRRRCYR